MDGNTSDKAADGSIAISAKTRRPFWDVDLGDYYDITRIEIFGQTDNESTLDQIGILIKKTSLDKGELYSDDSIGIRSEEIGSPHIIRTQPAGTRIGRFVRIIKNVELGVLALAEVRVFGKPCSPTKAELAWQPDTAPEFWIHSPLTHTRIVKSGEFANLAGAGLPENSEWGLEVWGIENGFYLREKNSNQYLYQADDGLRVGDIEKEAPSAIWVFEHYQKNIYNIKNHKSSNHLRASLDGQGNLDIGPLMETLFSRWNADAWAWNHDRETNWHHFIVSENATIELDW